MGSKISGTGAGLANCTTLGDTRISLFFSVGSMASSEMLGGDESLRKEKEGEWTDHFPAKTVRLRSQKKPFHSQHSSMYQGPHISARPCLPRTAQSPIILAL